MKGNISKLTDSSSNIVAECAYNQRFCRQEVRLIIWIAWEGRMMSSGVDGGREDNSYVQADPHCGRVRMVLVRICYERDS